MDVDRRTSRFLAGLRNGGGSPIHMSSPHEVRQRNREVMETNGPGPRMHRVVDGSARRADGGSVPVRVLIPTPTTRAVVVYFHGGGWVSGSIAESETIARKLAERTSSAFVLVDYRLAPEDPHPAAVEDCYAALEWVAENIADIAEENALLMLAGDDAGGTLAAVVAMIARDLSGPTITTQMLICPLLDPVPGEAGVEADEAGWVGPAALSWFWEQYVPDAAHRSSPQVSPLEADDLAGLPPAVIVTAEHSPARAGAQRYAQRLRDAGVEVDEHMYDGQIHNFPVILSIPLGERVFQQVIRTVRGYWMRARRADELALKQMEESKL